MKIERLLETDEIFIKIKNEYDEQINKEVCKRFSLKRFKFEKVNDDRYDNVYHIEMDDNFIVVNIDRYNNLNVLKISNQFSLDYLSKFRDFCNNYLENECSYHHRSGRGLLIGYLRKYYENISKDTLEKMCEIDDIDGEKYSKFRSWVYNSSCDYEIKEKFNLL